MARLFVRQSLKFRAERRECHDLGSAVAPHLRARRGAAHRACARAGGDRCRRLAGARGRRLRNIDLPDPVGEMTTVIERYGRPSCRTTSVRLMHACAPISVRPANSLVLLENVRKNINARLRKTNVPGWRGAIPKLEAKTHNSCCRKRFRSPTEINDWRRL